MVLICVGVMVVYSFFVCVLVFVFGCGSGVYVRFLFFLCAVTHVGV